MFNTFRRTRTRPEVPAPATVAEFTPVDVHDPGEDARFNKLRPIAEHASVRRRREALVDARQKLEEVRAAELKRAKRDQHGFAIYKPGGNARIERARDEVRAAELAKASAVQEAEAQVVRDAEELFRAIEERAAPIRAEAAELAAALKKAGVCDAHPLAGRIRGLAR